MLINVANTVKAYSNRYGFNSLFEMHAHRNDLHGRRVLLVFVSILYLRCLRRGAVKEAVEALEVSILYLRCTTYATRRPSGRLARSCFNSLFEMLRGVLYYYGLERLTFQFSI